MLVISMCTCKVYLYRRDNLKRKFIQRGEVFAPKRKCNNTFCCHIVNIMYTFFNYIEIYEIKKK